MAAKSLNKRVTKQEFALLFRMECRQHGIKVGMKWIADDPELLACYEPYKRIVEFTRRLINLDYATVMWIIRHELAHALEYRDLGEERNWYCNQEDAHGDNWKRYCKVVGCPATQQIPI